MTITQMRKLYLGKFHLLLAVNLSDLKNAHKAKNMAVIQAQGENGEEKQNNKNTSHLYS